MAFPKPPPISSLILLLLVTAEHAIAIKLDAGTMFGFGHLPPLLNCAPTPSKNDSAYRANVLSVLAALPAAAAGAPTGFASTQSGGGAGRDRAFARALCFGFGQRHGPSPGACLACLSAATRDAVVSGCGDSRRAGVWRAGCFLSYADTNASSAHEDAFRGWFYDDVDGPPAAAAASHCAGDRTAAECSRCADESARVAAALKRGHHLARIHGNAVVVVGYHCYLRVLIEAVLPWQLLIVMFFMANLTIASLVLSVLTYCIMRAQDMIMNPA